MNLKVQIACKKTALAQVRDFIWAGLDKAGLSDHHDALLMVVAVEEVCTNVMIHSLKLNPNASIDVIMQTNDSEVAFEVIDHGEASFNIESYEIPSINELIKEKKSGSIGLILVKGIMDEIRLKKGKSGEKIYLLTKHLSKQNSPD